MLLRSELLATEVRRRVAGGEVSDDDSVGTVGDVTVSSDLTEFDLESDMWFNTQQRDVPAGVPAECRALGLRSLCHWLSSNDICSSSSSSSAVKEKQTSGLSFWPCYLQ